MHLYELLKIVIPRDIIFRLSKSKKRSETSPVTISHSGRAEDCKDSEYDTRIAALEHDQSSQGQVLSNLSAQYDTISGQLNEIRGKY